MCKDKLPKCGIFLKSGKSCKVSGVAFEKYRQCDYNWVLQQMFYHHATDFYDSCMLHSKYMFINIWPIKSPTTL